MIDNANIKVIILDTLKFTIILLTFPIWMIYKFLRFKFNTLVKNA